MSLDKVVLKRESKYYLLKIKQIVISRWVYLFILLAVWML